MDSSGMEFVCLTCLITYIFILVFVWAIFRSGALADERTEEILKNQMNHEDMEDNNASTV